MSGRQPASLAEVVGNPALTAFGDLSSPSPERDRNASKLSLSPRSGNYDHRWPVAVRRNSCSNNTKRGDDLDRAHRCNHRSGVEQCVARARARMLTVSAGTAGRSGMNRRCSWAWSGSAAKRRRRAAFQFVTLSQNGRNPRGIKIVA
jgi:hypothetical protein